MMMAAKHPAIDLLGITIVAGNQTLDKTLINGLNVCQKLEINVPVYAGDAAAHYASTNRCR